MEFANRPETAFYIFIGLYLLLYSAYLVRFYMLCRKTGNRFNPIVYKLFLRTTYFSLMLISLLGPTFGLAKKDVPIAEKDVFIALDLSASMTADDVLPSRFEKAKASILKLIELVNSSRIGIIIFTSDAFLHSPLTSDKNALRSLTEILSPDLIESKGTDYAEPLRLALEKFKKRNDSPLSSSAIILISDGKDFSSELSNTMDELKNESIKIFSLGIGTENGSAIRVSNENVRVTLDRSTLIKISKSSGGKYFEVSNEIDETDKLTQSLNNLKSDGIKVVKADTNSIRYAYFLIPALLLMLLDVFVTINVLRI